jgi:hypothetical protein
MTQDIEEYMNYIIHTDMHHTQTHTIHVKSQVYVYLCEDINPTGRIRSKMKLTPLVRERDGGRMC